MDKKEEILISASTIFSRNGYKNTKITDIANEAKIGKSTVYDYFNSKEELFFNVIGYWTDISDKLLRKIIDDEDTAENKLKLIFFKGLDFLEKDGVNIRVSFLESYSLCVNSKKAFDDFYKIWYDSLYKIIEIGIKNKEFRDKNIWAMIYMFEGALSNYFNDIFVRKMERKLEKAQLFEEIIDSYKY